MTRREIRARLTAQDQQRIAAIAEQFGWSGIALTVWALNVEMDGGDVDKAIAVCELVAQLAAMPGHDPTEHVSPQGKRYTVVTVPLSAGIPEPALIPPVPGKATHTFVVPLPPPGRPNPLATPPPPEVAP